MNRRRRPLWQLVISFLSLGGLIYLIISFPPTTQFTLPFKALAKWGIFSASWRIPILYIFFSLFFVFLLSLVSYLLRSSRRAIIISLLTLIYLILLMFRLSSPYFLLLLLALYVSLELFFKKHI